MVGLGFGFVGTVLRTQKARARQERKLGLA